MSDLDARLLAAHTAHDHKALVDLYCEAAHAAPTPEASGFYLVHAYVYALETAHPDSKTIQARLKQMGREA